MAHTPSQPDDELKAFKVLAQDKNLIHHIFEMNKKALGEVMCDSCNWTLKSNYLLERRQRRCDRFSPSKDGAQEAN